jgi:hypothetical protein
MTMGQGRNPIAGKLENNAMSLRPTTMGQGRNPIAGQLENNAMSLRPTTMGQGRNPIVENNFQGTNIWLL